MEEYKFEYEVYDSIDELNKDDAALLKMAREKTKDAYAPYSNFYVAAAARLHNGTVVTGTNQENASYPVAICAERTLLSTAGNMYKNVPMHTMAITYNTKKGSTNSPVSPCGMCRQALVEFENRTKNPIRLILAGMKGKVYVIPKASMLLPFSFSAEDLAG